MLPARAHDTGVPLPSLLAARGALVLHSTIFGASGGCTARTFAEYISPIWSFACATVSVGTSKAANNALQKTMIASPFMQGPPGHGEWLT